MGSAHATDAAAPQHSPLDRVFALVFAAALCVPGLAYLTVGGGDVSAELRKARPLPEPPTSLSDWTRFSDGFDAWWADHAGLRTWFLERRARALWFGLRASPNPAVQRGAGDWLFLTREGALAAALGYLPIDERELIEWEYEIASRRDFAAGLGAEYRMVLVPGKAAIYPEKVPGWLEQRGPSRLVQFTEHLAAAGLPVSNQLELMRAERARDTAVDLAYWPLGTHWTHRAAAAGAISVTRGLASQLAGLQPVAPTRIRVVEGLGQGDSWAGRLYLDGLLTQTAMRVTWQPPLSAKIDGSDSVDEFRGRTIAGSGPEKLSAWIAHDSFAATCLTVLAEPFGSVYTRQDQALDDESIRARAPDLVLEYYVDRSLFNHSPTLRRPSLAPRLAAAFETLAGESEARTVGAHTVGAYTVGAYTVRPRTSRSVGVTTSGAAGDEVVFADGDARLVLDTRDWPDADVVLLEIEVECERGMHLAVGYERERFSIDPRQPTSARYRLQPGRNRLVVYLPLYRMRGAPWLALPQGGSVRLLSLQRVDTSVARMAELLGPP
jgi:hypothetical protein